MRYLLAICVFCFSVNSAADARQIKIVTWNLGWHLSQSQAEQWIAKCNGLFAKNEATGLFEPSSSGGKPGWELTWGRDAPILWDIAQWPPCDVYKTSFFKTVPVTSSAYQKRLEQIQKFISAKLQPDVIAFQEVSGEQAVREILPEAGKDYFICSFSVFKIQRLAFAWKRELGASEECATEEALTLPNEALKDRVRPGLSLSLRIEGKPLRLLNVHLKSSCVSPLEATDENGKGALAGSNEACVFLQKQIVPLEKWIEEKSVSIDRFIILGDFNRNFWHEQNTAGDVRTDRSDPTGELAPTAKVRNLLREINDGAPVKSKLTLLDEHCPTNDFTRAKCLEAKSAVLSRSDANALAKVPNLGCRNAVGLDHILIGTEVTAQSSAEKISLGKMGRTLPASSSHPDPLLAVSDHCPLAVTVNF